MSAAAGPETDRSFLLQALALAARARYRCHPNPMVGCLIVQAGEVVGEGYHQRRGCAHAEVHALRRADGRARGATVYVTLEPCSHQGLTPPCADALIQAGVARVVVAMVDPDPRVQGRGIARLRAAGISVSVGCCEAEAEALNRPWLHHRRTGHPYVLLKAAQSLDGKIATVSGESRWVSGAPSRAEVHQLRDQVDAILVGIGTVLHDDPQLACRCAEPGPLALGWELPSAVRLSPALAGASDQPAWQPRHPLRVVLDSHARTPPSARLLPALIAVAETAPAERRQALAAAGAELLVLPTAADGRLSLPHLLTELGRRGVCSLLVEGGAEVHGGFVAAGLAAGLRLYVSPRLFGGRGAPSAVGGPGIAALQAAPGLVDMHLRRLGDDLVLEGDLRYASGPALRE